MEFVGQKIKITTVTEQDLNFIGQLECDTNVWSFEETVETDEEKVREKYRSHFAVADEKPYAYDFVIRRVNDPEDTPIGIVQMWSYVDHRKAGNLDSLYFRNTQVEDTGEKLPDFCYILHFKSYKLIRLSACVIHKTSAQQH